MIKIAEKTDDEKVEEIDTLTIKIGKVDVNDMDMLGIPSRNDIDIVTALPSKSRKEIYDFVVKKIKEEKLRDKVKKKKLAKKE